MTDSQSTSDSYQNNEAPEGPAPNVLALATSWQVGLFVGIITLALGIVVTAHPTTSLNVIAVLVGVLLIVAGLLQLIRALDTSAAHRGWAAVVGLMFVVLGVVLIRHLHATRVLIALLVGITWIAQGVAALMTGFSEEHGTRRGWELVFGAVSLAAGIVVVAVPVGSLNALAILLGVWFIVIGILYVIGSLVLRNLVKEAA